VLVFIARKAFGYANVVTIFWTTDELWNGGFRQFANPERERRAGVGAYETMMSARRSRSGFANKKAAMLISITAFN